MVNGELIWKQDYVDCFVQLEDDMTIDKYEPRSQKIYQFTEPQIVKLPGNLTL